jgi:gluconate 2-dehydrogenase gamma chain
VADNPTLLTRRTAIKNAVALLGGTLTATQLGLLSDSFAAIAEDAPPRFLSHEQFAMLSRIADLIIPETDTPGALGVGVPHFIDMMLADWASPQRQARYVAGLDDIDKRARDSGTSNFSASTTEQQIVLLRALDKEFFAEDPRDPFFGELKKMVLFAYYSSEAGATVELRFQRIPGDYLPCVPMADDSHAWFWSQYNYGL